MFSEEIFLRFSEIFSIKWVSRFYCYRFTPNFIVILFHQEIHRRGRKQWKTVLMKEKEPWKLRENFSCCLKLRRKVIAEKKKILINCVGRNIEITRDSKQQNCLYLAVHTSASLFNLKSQNNLTKNFNFEFNELIFIKDCQDNIFFNHKSSYYARSQWVF